MLADLGGEAAGEEPGRAWAAGRFDAPYLRDSMLDAGVLVETLETATYWSRLRATYDAVSTALAETLGDPAMVLCHVSHVYETGASLYFTVAAPEGDDPLGRWLRRQARRDGRHRRRRRDDHPPPRGRHRPPAVARGRDRAGGGRGAASGQGGGRPRAGSSTPACWFRERSASPKDQTSSWVGTPRRDGDVVARR